MRTALIVAAVTGLGLSTPLDPSKGYAHKKKCVVAHVEQTGSKQQDDSPAIKRAFAECSSNAIVEFTEGVTYNVLTPIAALNLTNVDIRLLGNLSLPNDIPAVQSAVRAAAADPAEAALYTRLSWFRFQGDRVNWFGNPDSEWGWIDCHGQQWYDANKPGQSGLPDRPGLFSWRVSNSLVDYFKVWKPIGWNTELAKDNITVTNARIDAISDGPGFAFNTDGFGINGKNIKISKSSIFNGDDAVAVHDGAENFLFEDSTIGWETHGMSIGSLGQNPKKAVKISNIRFNRIKQRGGLYAARFKSWQGGTGLVKNVTWNDIDINNVTFPVYITQKYFNQDLPTRTNGTSAVNMDGFTWSNWKGLINDRNPGDGSCVSNPCWYNVGLDNLTHREAAIILCENDDSCKNFEFKNFHVNPLVKMFPEVICEKAGAANNPKLGFECKRGQFLGVA